MLKRELKILFFRKKLKEIILIIINKNMIKK